MNLSNYGVLEGRLVKDILILENKDSSRKALFTLAVQNNYKSRISGKKETQFIPIEGFIPAGQSNGVYDLIHKGDLISVVYELKNDSFNKNGQTHYKLTVNTNHIDLKEPKAVTEARLARREYEERESSIPFV